MINAFRVTSPSGYCKLLQLIHSLQHSQHTIPAPVQRPTMLEGLSYVCLCSGIAYVLDALSCPVASHVKKHKHSESGVRDLKCSRLGHLNSGAKVIWSSEIFFLTRLKQSIVDKFFYLVGLVVKLKYYKISRPNFIFKTKY